MDVEPGDLEARPSTPVALYIVASAESPLLTSYKPQVLHEVGGQPLLCLCLLPAVQLQSNFESITVLVAQKHRTAVEAAVKQNYPSLPFTCLVVNQDWPTAEDACVVAALQACAHAPEASRALIVNAGCCQTPMTITNALGCLLDLPDFTDDCTSVTTAADTSPAICRAVMRSSSAARQQGMNSWLACLSEPSPGGKRALEFLFSGKLAPELDQPVSRRSLAAFSARTSMQSIEALQDAGVFFQDARSCWIGPAVTIGMDTYIGPGVQLYGATEIGESAQIDGPTVIRDSFVGDGSHIRSFTVLEGAQVEGPAGAGPFARLRQGTVLSPNSYVGNFCETKNATLASNSLACHLSYLGDAEVGPRTNLGAGLVTCNFDGVAKNRTRIGSDCFVGSSSTLVAPVFVGDGALIAAGSVVTKDVEPGAAVFGRSRQTDRAGFADELRSRTRAAHAQKS